MTNPVLLVIETVRAFLDGAIRVPGLERRVLGLPPLTRLGSSHGSLPGVDTPGSPHAALRAWWGGVGTGAEISISRFYSVEQQE